MDSDAQARLSSFEVAPQPTPTDDEPQTFVIVASEVEAKNGTAETDSEDPESARDVEVIQQEDEADDEQDSPSPSQRVPQQHETEADDGDDGPVESFFPSWIQTNFPDIASELELQQCHFQSETVRDHRKHQQHNQDELAYQSDPQLVSELLCEECCARDAAFCCVQCDQRLCFKCTDAIHIVSFDLVQSTNMRRYTPVI